MIQAQLRLFDLRIQQRDAAPISLTAYAVGKFSARSRVVSFFLYNKDLIVKKQHFSAEKCCFFFFNGEKCGLTSLMGGKEFAAGLYVLDNEIYIPTYMLAKMLGYFFAI